MGEAVIVVCGRVRFRTIESSPHGEAREKRVETCAILAPVGEEYDDRQHYRRSRTSLANDAESIQCPRRRRTREVGWRRKVLRGRVARLTATKRASMQRAPSDLRTPPSRSSSAFCHKVHEHSETGFAKHQQLVHNLGRGGSRAFETIATTTRMMISASCVRACPYQRTVFAPGLQNSPHRRPEPRRGFLQPSLGHRCRTPAYESSTAACAR